MPDDKRPLKVFLCHAHADKAQARDLYRTLKRRGLQPWLDAEDLLPGQAWQVEIPKALESSDAIIILLSKTSVDKEGYVQKEIKFALDKALEMPEGRIFVIPARLDACNVPRSLNGYHWVDLFDGGGYAKLMKSLKVRAAQLERATVQVSKQAENSSYLAEKPKQESHEGVSVHVNGNVQGNSIIGNDNAVQTLPVQKDENITQSLEERRKELLALQDKAIKYESSGKKQEALRIYEEIRTSVILLHINDIDIDTKITALKLELNSTRQKPPRKLKTEYIIAIIGAAATILAALIGILPQIFKPVVPTTTNTPTLPLTPTPLLTEIVDAKGVTMRLAPAGEFVMGSDSGHDDERPAHKVLLDTFYIDKYEVNNKLYKDCVDEGACRSPYSNTSYTRISYYGNNKYENYPVIFVDWNMASTYCVWRDASLPTEAQWEKAARGIDERDFPWGNKFDQSFANVNNPKGDTAPVGSNDEGKSPYDIYDMTGNVWEWVADWYGQTYYLNSPPYNPTGPSGGPYRVLRGGSWMDVELSKLRTTYRGGELGDIVRDLFLVGFRCATDIPP